MTETEASVAIYYINNPYAVNTEYGQTKHRQMVGGRLVRNET